jgi:hypothetical protein
MADQRTGGRCRFLGVPTRPRIHLDILHLPAMALASLHSCTSDDVTCGSWRFDPFRWSFPLGLAPRFESPHLVTALAAACGMWTRWSIGSRVG